MNGSLIYYYLVYKEFILLCWSLLLKWFGDDEERIRISMYVPVRFARCEIAEISLS